MLHHVVVVILEDGVTDEQVEEVLGGLAALPAAIPQIRSYRFGRDAGLSPNDFGIVVVAEFDSAEDFAAYRAHPAHVAFRQDLLVPVSAAITSTQFFSRR